MAKLCVNVDHVATVRQARMITNPDPLEAALLAESAGAVGITIHLREDRRHIQDKDVPRIKKGINTKLNLEMALANEIVEIAHKVKPHQVTFVPEKRREITTEGGLDITKGRRKTKKIIDGFKDRKIVVSLFIDPDEDQIRVAHDLSADAIEINTGAYSEAGTKREIKSRLRKIEKGAILANNLGLATHAGHGLNVNNVGAIAAISTVEELNIGHSIVSRAIMIGFSSAVKEMIGAITTRIG